MFTLKLYQNGPLPPNGRTVVMEVVGVWIDNCDNGVKHIHTFRKKVGVADENDSVPADFYVGGDFGVPPKSDALRATMNAIDFGPYGNHFGWAVLENAQGKTTEMIR